MTGTAAPTRRSPGLRIGSVAGVPVYLGRTWPIIVVVIVALFGPNLAASRPDLGAGAYAVALAFALLLLVSVLAHEAAHAVVGRLCGYQVARVVADFWGGHTAYNSSDSTPGGSALVAVAGPVANGVLAGAGVVVLPLLPPDIPTLLGSAFVWANAFVAAFNLLPGLPLDGGYLVDALVWKVTGSRERGMIAAGWGGRLLTVALVLAVVGWPLLQGDPPSLFTVVWAWLLGWFLWMGASNAVRTGKARLLLSTITIGSVWRPATEVPAAVPVGQVLSHHGRLIDLDRTTLVVIDEDGRARGVVDPAAVRRIPEGHRDGTPVSAGAQGRPAGWVVAGDPAEPITEVVATMQELRISSVAVRTGSGRVEGIIHAGDL